MKDYELFEITIMVLDGMLHTGHHMIVKGTKNELLDCVLMYCDMWKKKLDFPNITFVIKYKELIKKYNKCMENSKMVRLDERDIKYHFNLLLKEIEKFKEENNI